MIGLNVDQYAHDLTIDERRAVDAWLRLIGQERNAWIEYALLDESGTTLSIKRYLLNEDGNPTLSGDVSSPRVFMEDAGRIGEQAQQMKLAALGRLTASIAHEIRNPLGAISHAGQLLSENLPEQAQEQNQNHRLLAIIHRHTARINVIIEEMLGLSRRGESVPQSLHLRSWLEQLAREYCEAKPGATPRIDCEK